MQVPVLGDAAGDFCASLAEKRVSAHTSFFAQWPFQQIPPVLRHSSAKNQLSSSPPTRTLPDTRQASFRSYSLRSFPQGLSQRNP